MRILRIVVLAVAGAVLAPGVAYAGGHGWLRRYIATYTSRRATRTLIPAWARKYNMNCSGCHYPAPPRLNATGMRFKWAGYRMEDDFNETVSVEKEIGRAHV